MTEDDGIRLSGIYKSYWSVDGREVRVLNDFSLSVARGEILGIHGPNGCGKSTILGIVAGILRADEGSVLVSGRPPTAGGVGCLFQDYNASLFPWLTCSENITFSLRLRGLSGDQRRRQANGIVERLHMDLDLTKYPYELSGGQQQLVALARALCDSPSALVMDEPFSSLDATVRERVRREAVRVIDEQGLTALLVSHNLEDCILCSDRIAFITPLPAQIHRVERVPLIGLRHQRRPHSNQFADVLETFRTIAVQAGE